MEECNLTLLHRSFLRFLNGANGRKSHKASHLVFIKYSTHKHQIIRYQIISDIYIK